MTEDEKKRLQELTFIKFVQAIIRLSDNPFHVVDFLEKLCTLAKADKLVLSSITSIILSNDHRYIPQRVEVIYLLSKSKKGVREICKYAGLSQSTYYKIKNETPALVITPKFTEQQREVMLKVMNKMIGLTEPIERILL